LGFAELNGLLNQMIDPNWGLALPAFGIEFDEGGLNGPFGG
jgi:hypothetical protein